MSEINHPKKTKHKSKLEIPKEKFSREDIRYRDNSGDKNKHCSNCVFYKRANEICLLMRENDNEVNEKGACDKWKRGKDLLLDLLSRFLSELKNK